MRTLRLPLRVAAVLLAAAALNPSLGHADAGAKSPTIDVNHPVSDAGADGATPTGVPPGGFPPDPSPLVMKRQWLFSLQFHHRDVQVTQVRAVELPRPTPTPRTMGRFALEQYVGSELVERVRFDFPLLAADEFASDPKRPFGAPPSFEHNLTSSTSVLVPRSERTVHAFIIDRSTGRRWPIPWPPVSAISADAAATP